MEEIIILTAGTHPQVMLTLERVLAKNDGWKPVLAFSLEEIKSQLKTVKFDVVLLGAGFSDGDETAIQDLMKNEHPSIPLVKHYGGGSGLILAEIHQAIGR